MGSSPQHRPMLQWHDLRHPAIWWHTDKPTLHRTITCATRIQSTTSHPALITFLATCLYPPRIHIPKRSRLFNLTNGLYSASACYIPHQLRNTSVSCAGKTRLDPQPAALKFSQSFFVNFRGHFLTHNHIIQRYKQLPSVPGTIQPLSKG